MDVTDMACVLDWCVSGWDFVTGVMNESFLFFKKKGGGGNYMMSCDPAGFSSMSSQEFNTIIFTT